MGARFSRGRRLADCPKTSVLLGPFAKNGSPKGVPFGALFGVDFRRILRSLLGSILDRFWSHLEPFQSTVVLFGGLLFLRIVF